MEKFYLSKALLARGEDASPTSPPPLDPLLTGTLFFQPHDVCTLVKVGCDFMFYSIHTVEHRWRLGSVEDTTSILIVAGKLVQGSISDQVA